MRWLPGDDKCDCTFQRIGFWTNPYLAETHEIRLCCLYAEFAKMWPQFFRTTPASWNRNEARWVETPQKWENEDMPMPLPIWHRQIARETGKSLAQVRKECKGKEHTRPKAKPWFVGKKYQTIPREVREKALEKELREAGWIVGEEKLVIKAGVF